MLSTAVTSPELHALMHTLDALDWAARTLMLDPGRVGDVATVCGCAAEEARNLLLAPLLERDAA